MWYGVCGIKTVGGEVFSSPPIFLLCLRHLNRATRFESTVFILRLLDSCKLTHQAKHLVISFDEETKAVLGGIAFEDKRDSNREGHDLIANSDGGSRGSCAASPQLQANVMRPWSNVTNSVAP